MSRATQHPIPAGLKSLDAFAVARIFGVTDPCLQDALGQLLALGGAPSKSGLAGVIAALQRKADLDAVFGDVSAEPVRAASPMAVELQVPAPQRKRAAFLIDCTKLRDKRDVLQATSFSDVMIRQLVAGLDKKIVRKSTARKICEATGLSWDELVCGGLPIEREDEQLALVDATEVAA